MAADLRRYGRRAAASVRPLAVRPLLRRARAPALALVVVAAALCLSWSSATGPVLTALVPLPHAAVRAQSALATMQTAYYLAPVQAYAAAPGAGQPGNLWSDSWALAALEDVAALPGGSVYLPQVRAAADGLQAYWDAAAQPPAYGPVAHAGPGIVKYYDDNAWAGLDLVAAYRLTGDATYLRRAMAVMRYAETGWDPSGGGLWWSDQHQYRSTATNAATAELAAQLYRTTGDRADLAWAERIYAWERRNLVTPAGRVEDGVPGGDAQWTYNYGSVIAAGVSLYHATGRRSYLVDAESVADYALRHLRQPGGAWLPPASFDGVLADGILALWRVDRQPALAAALTRNANLAWSAARGGAGLFGDDFNGPPPGSGAPLLADTGAVRALAAAAAMASGGTPPSPSA